MTGPPLSPRLAELLAVGSSSLTLGVAALARVADPLGRASFGDLAVAYREEYLNLQQQTMGARAPEPGALSGDDVRTHLGSKCTQLGWHPPDLLARILTREIISENAPGHTD